MIHVTRKLRRLVCWPFGNRMRGRTGTASSMGRTIGTSHIATAATLPPTLLAGDQGGTSLTPQHAKLKAKRATANGGTPPTPNGITTRDLRSSYQNNTAHQVTQLLCTEEAEDGNQKNGITAL